MDDDIANNTCPGCQQELFIEEGPAFYNCSLCGYCFDHVIFQGRPRTSINWLPPRKDANGHVARTVMSTGTHRRRYKRIFHYMERMQQWRCAESIPERENLVDELANFINSSRYANSITRGTIMHACHATSNPTRKESWKYLCLSLGSHVHLPSSELVDACVNIFTKLSKRFPIVAARCYRGGLLIGTHGQNRHNMFNLNYVHRKILESFGIWDWHREFPILRTATKLHQLDDCNKELFADVGLPFQRTAVIQFPKCHKRKRHVPK